MDPSRTTYRGQWTTSSPYVMPVYSPPSVYGTPGRKYSSHVPVMNSVPIGVSYSSRTLASSVRDVPPSPPSSRRRLYHDAPEPRSSSGYSSGLSSYRRSSTSRSHDPYDVSSSNSVSCSQSSKLTRRIDKFLKNSEQSLERPSRRPSISRTGAPDSPEMSLSLSGRAFRSTSAASIAVKADRHLESLRDGKKTAAGVCSTSESLDDLDSDSDEGLNDISDDTSADLSKLDELSSDSDDEFFDVIPILKPAEQPKPVAPSAAPVTASHTPNRSQSGPSLSRAAQCDVMVVGAAPKTASGTPAPVSSTAPKGAKPLASSVPERPVTPSPSHKKGPAPQPPGSLSRQASSASIVRPKDVTTSPLPEPLARQASSTSLARHSVAVSEDGTVPNTPAAGKHCQRAPSFKKYAAPLPPGVSRQGSMVSINSLAAADKPIAPAAPGTASSTLAQTSSMANVTADKSRVEPKQTNGVSPDHKTEAGTASAAMTNGVKGSSDNIANAATPDPQASHNNVAKTSNGHVDDILTAFKKGASESLQQLKNGTTESTDFKLQKSSVCNGVASNNDDAHKTVSKRSASRDVSADSSAGDDDRSRSSASRDGSSKKTGSRKLSAISSKFEIDSTKTEPKSVQKSSSEAKGNRFNPKIAKNKLGNLASKFEVADTNSENVRDSRSPSIGLGKLQSPYSKPFDPEPIIAPVTQRKSIGGINVSKFGGTGKFPTQSQLRKNSKSDTSEASRETSAKDEMSESTKTSAKDEVGESTKQTIITKEEKTSIGCKDEKSAAKSAEPITIIPSSAIDLRDDKSVSNKEEPKKNHAPIAVVSAQTPKAEATSKETMTSSQEKLPVFTKSDGSSVAPTSPAVSSTKLSSIVVKASSAIDVTKSSSTAQTDVAKDRSSPPTDVAKGSSSAPTDVAKNNSTAPVDVAKDGSSPPVDVAKDSSSAQTDVAKGSSSGLVDVAKDSSSALTDVAKGSNSAPTDEVKDNSSAPNGSLIDCSSATRGVAAAATETSLAAASFPTVVVSSNSVEKIERPSITNSTVILSSLPASSAPKSEQSVIVPNSLPVQSEGPASGHPVSPPSSATGACASSQVLLVAPAVLPCVGASAASEPLSIQLTLTPALAAVSPSPSSINTDAPSVSSEIKDSPSALPIAHLSPSDSSISGTTPLDSSDVARSLTNSSGVSGEATSPVSISSQLQTNCDTVTALNQISSLLSQTKSEKELETTTPYSTPSLDVTRLDFPRASDGLNLSILSPSLSIPSASIYTRASSVSPSISSGITGLSVTGLNLPYPEDSFSRARSLTPLEGRSERSVRPKSRFLKSDARGSEMTFSSIELDKPESALEKYRRRKEMRNSATRSKLDALTKQKKEASLSDTSLSSNVTLDVPATASSVSSKEGTKFKIDLSSIKDFLRKTEEEISKLPRYIREPWTMSEMLSTRVPEASAAGTDEKEPAFVQGAVCGASRMSSPSADGLDNSSRKSSLDGSARLRHSPRSSDGDEEVYVDARDAIDTSQMDTLMPLPDPRDLERRCRSVTPSRVIANTEKMLSQTDRILKKSRSGNSLKKSYSRSLSAANIERLSEVVADLAEEHSTAQLAGERLEAEQADRMRLEKELDNAQNDMRELSVATERLESEKSVLRTEMLQHATSLNNGDLTEPDDASSASLYKRKFEWSQREVESLKQQLRQHQQDEQEQTGLLKKQLEKKVADAREETEEQRQVAAQLKKRTQRLQAEMNDLKILLEEQTARNILLEKKQRKFDSELAAGQDELRVERLNKEKVVRERDAHLAEKYAVDQELSTLKMELELRDERVAALTKQLDELSLTGQGDAEITQLRKGKHVLESKIKDQEEELDDLAGQVQVLEGARTRLEMSLEQLRKESRLEHQQRDEELEEVRCAAQKKVKALEAQVETEHEERTQLVREKHELERRMLELMDRSSVAPDDDAVHRLKKDLRKTKALLKDTQTMLEKTQSEGPSKLIIRQLKTQLEDCEFAKTAALKARQSADADLSEMQSSLDDAQRARKEADDRYSRLLKEKTELQTQLEEGEELHAETLKKYKSTVSQVSVDQITLSEQSQRVAELEQERQVLSDRLQELNSKVEVLEGETANIHTQRMLQMKVKELESKLELELATRKRIESQMTRLKEQLERLSGECDLAKLKEAQSSEQCKKMSRQLRQCKEEAAMVHQRNTELSSKKQEQEKQMELMDSEISTLKSDLKLAFKRIEDLQMALQGDISDSDSDLSDSESDSDTSLTNYLTSSARASRSASASARLPNRTPASPTNRGEDSMSPGSDAMAIIEEAKEEVQHSESFA